MKQYITRLITSAICIMMFQSLVAQPAAPVVIAPTNITVSTFYVNWNAVSGASDYFIDISTVSNFATFVSGWQNFNTYSAATSKGIYGIGCCTPGTVYYFRVRATNASGTSANSNTGSVLLLPSVPTGLTFSDPSNVTSQINVSWNAMTGASEYRIDVSTVSNFSSFVSGYNNLQVLGTSQSITGLSSGTAYYIRVRSGNSSGYSSYASGSKATLPAAPSVTSITRSGISYTVNWGAVTGGEYYTIWLYQEYNGMVWGIFDSSFGEGMLTYTFTYTETCERFWVELEAASLAGGWGPKSSLYEYNLPCGGRMMAPDEATDTNTPAAQTSEHVAWTLSPNPSDNIITLDLPKGSSPDDFRFSFTNPNGNEFNISTKATSAQSVEFNISHLALGSYILNVGDGSTIRRLRFIKK
ncbi:MAG: T9SS type A sorting domain-containing protein [Bacteroidota bacterium]